MRRLLTGRTFLSVLVFVIAASLLVVAFETEGSGHQPEMHHCVLCCTTHHVAAAPSQGSFQPILLATTPLNPAPTAIYRQIFVHQLDPIPKLLA
jgi:hypothetical protein